MSEKIPNKLSESDLEQKALEYASRALKENVNASKKNIEKGICEIRDYFSHIPEIQNIVNTDAFKSKLIQIGFYEGNLDLSKEGVNGREGTEEQKKLWDDILEKLMTKYDKGYYTKYGRKASLQEADAQIEKIAIQVSKQFGNDDYINIYREGKAFFRGKLKEQGYEESKLDLSKEGVNGIEGTEEQNKLWDDILEKLMTKYDKGYYIKYGRKASLQEADAQIEKIAIQVSKQFGNDDYINIYREGKAFFRGKLKEQGYEESKLDLSKEGVNGIEGTEEQNKLWDDILEKLMTKYDKGYYTKYGKKASLQEAEAQIEKIAIQVSKQFGNDDYINIYREGKAFFRGKLKEQGYEESKLDLSKEGVNGIEGTEEQKNLWDDVLAKLMTKYDKGYYAKHGKKASFGEAEAQLENIAIQVSKRFGNDDYINIYRDGKPFFNRKLKERGYETAEQSSYDFAYFKEDLNKNFQTLTLEEQLTFSEDKLIEQFSKNLDQNEREGFLKVLQDANTYVLQLQKNAKEDASHKTMNNAEIFMRDHFQAFENIDTAMNEFERKYDPVSVIYKEKQYEIRDVLQACIVKKQDPKKNVPEKVDVEDIVDNVSDQNTNDFVEDAVQDKNIDSIEGDENINVDLHESKNENTDQTSIVTVSMKDSLRESETQDILTGDEEIKKEDSSNSRKVRVNVENSSPEKENTLEYTFVLSSGLERVLHQKKLLNNETFYALLDRLFELAKNIPKGAVFNEEWLLSQTVYDISLGEELVGFLANSSLRLPHLLDEATLAWNDACFGKLKKSKLLNEDSKKEDLTDMNNLESFDTEESKTLFSYTDVKEVSINEDVSPASEVTQEPDIVPLEVTTQMEDGIVLESLEISDELTEFSNENIVETIEYEFDSDTVVDDIDFSGNEFLDESGVPNFDFIDEMGIEKSVQEFETHENLVVAQSPIDEDITEVQSSLDTQNDTFENISEEADDEKILQEIIDNFGNTFELSSENIQTVYSFFTSFKEELFEVYRLSGKEKSSFIEGLFSIQNELFFTTFNILRDEIVNFTDVLYIMVGRFFENKNNQTEQFLSLKNNIDDLEDDIISSNNIESFFEKNLRKEDELFFEKNFTDLIIYAENSETFEEFITRISQDKKIVDWLDKKEKKDRDLFEKMLYVLFQSKRNRDSLQKKIQKSEKEVLEEKTYTLFDFVQTLEKKLINKECALLFSYSQLADDITIGKTSMCVDRFVNNILENVSPHHCVFLDIKHCFSYLNIQVQTPESIIEGISFEKKHQFQVDMYPTSFVLEQEV